MTPPPLPPLPPLPATRLRAGTVLARTLFSLLASLLACLLGAAAPAQAQDRLELDTTRITGHSELPKVIYIVPWKAPPATRLSPRPPASLLDEPPAPLDRDVFRRQLAYGQSLGSPATTAVAPTVTPAVTPGATPSATSAASAPR